MVLRSPVIALSPGVGGFTIEVIFIKSIISYYDCKVIEYPDGSVQIHLYDNPIPLYDDLSDYEDFPFGGEPQPLCEPFTGQEVKEVKFFTSDEKQRSSTEIEENRERSYRRCKNMIFRYARCYKWEYFITITFSPDKVDRTNFTECSRKLRRWLNNQRVNAPDFKYLFVPELHADGKSWHFHGLMADIGDIKFVDSGHKSKGDIIYNLGKWSYGFSTATIIKDTNRVSKYIGKYITKTVCALTEKKHRYYVFSNLPMPFISTYSFPGESKDNVIKYLSDLYSRDVGACKTVQSDFNTVTYIELVNYDNSTVQ